MDPKKELQPRKSQPERPIVSMPEVGVVQPEVESWMQKIEKRFARVPNQTQTPMDDPVVVQQPQSQQPPVTLPINSVQMQAGKKASVEEGIAWLVTWVVRQIKKFSKLGQRVRLQDIPEVKE